MRTHPRAAARPAVLATLLLLSLMPAAVAANDPAPSPGPSLDPAPVATDAPAPAATDAPAPAVTPDPTEPPPDPTASGTALPDPTPAGGVGTRRPGGEPDAAGPAGGPTPPTLGLTLPGSTRSTSIAIKLPTSDPGGSGIKGWFVSENPATPGLSANGWKGVKPSTFTLSTGQGVKTVYAWAKTKNGAISARASDTIKLDTTPPTVALTAPADAAARTITISLAWEDPLSGGVHPAADVNRWAVVNGTTAPGKDSQAWKTAAPSTFKLSAGNGVKTVSAFVRDAAGNVSAPSTATVTLQITGPAVTVSLPVATRTRAVAVTLSATDPGGTGIAGYHLSQSGTAPGSSATWALLPTTFTLSEGDGPKILYVWAKDNNGTLSARAQASTLLDTTKPTVTLTAASTTTTLVLPVTIGGSDAGANASGITAWAVVNGTSVPASASGAWSATAPTSLTLSYGNGTKTFTAFARDAAGNVSVAVTRTVAMTIPAPSLTLALPTVTRLNPVSVTVTPSDPGGTGIAGYYLSESGSTPSATASGWSVFPGTTPLTSVQGAHTVYGWVKDKNGSVSARVQASTVLDTIKPTVTLTAPFATKPSAISITIVASDSGTGVVSWAIMPGTNPPASGFPEWKTSAPTSFTLSAGDGNKTISAFARDAAGNVSVAATKVVIVDNVAPSATLSAPAATATRPITVSVGGTDASSGVTAWAVVDGTTAPAPGDGAWVGSPPTGFTLPTSDSTKTISAFTRDAAGNVSAAATAAVLLDTTAPSIHLSRPTATNSTNPWVALDGSDGAGSGISHWAVVAGTTQPVPGSPTWTTTKPVNVAISTGDGSKTVSAWSRDAVGNVSLVHTRSILLDTVVPTVSLSGLPVLTADRTIAITLAGSDDASGIDDWAVTEGASAPSAGSGAWRSTMPTTYTITGSDGTRTIRAWTRDEAGNVSAASVASTVLDTTAPSVTFTVVAVTTTRTVALSITGNDGSGSGITGWAVVQGTDQPATGSDAWVGAPATAFELPAGDGATQITAFSRDLAGNVRAVTRTVVLDTTAPSATLDAPSVSGSRTIAVTLGGGDGAQGSGVTHWAVVEGTSAPASGDAAWVVSAPTSFQLSDADGSRTVSAFTRDSAGFVSAAASRTVLLDRVVPTAGLSAPATSATPVIPVSVSGTDGGSGVAAYVVVEGTSAPEPTSPAWSATPPTSVTVSNGLGPKTISAFTRDAAGNVSSASTVTVTRTAP